jgi:hypothetical protein
VNRLPVAGSRRCHPFADSDHRPQRIERIDHEGKRLKIDLDFLDGFRGGEFVDRGHRKNRFALINRFHGETALAPLAGLDHRAIVGKRVGWRGKIVRCENGFDAGHGERCFRIDAPYPRMRHWTEQQFAEQHAFRAKILSVLGIARDFCIEVRGLVVLANQFVPGAVGALGSLGGVSRFFLSARLSLSLSKRRPPHILRPAHQRRQNLVVILTAAEISRDPVRQLPARGIGIRFQESDRSHYEAGHAERALKSLLVDDTLLHRMQGSVVARQPFDRHNLPATHRVRQHRTRIMRNVVDKDGAGSTFRTVATELGAGQSQLVTQRPCQRLLLHDIDPPLLTVNVESNEALAHAGSQLLSLQHRGGTKKITGGGDGDAAADDAFDEVAP